MRRAAGALLLVLVAGCSSSGDRSTDRAEDITVFAAASLTQAFRAVGEAFEDAHPDVHLRFSFAGSQSLVAQVRQGAPAAVLATADTESLAKVRDELAADPIVFAHNSLAVLTAAGNPKGITTLADLARPGVRVVLADPAVPVGRAAAAALEAAGVVVRPRSLEDAVTGVVTKVRLGEADAGIAYVTDIAGDEVTGTPIAGTRTDLAIAELRDAPPAATDFVGFVQGPEGHRILGSFGFT